ncbi:hypothetical protein K378_00934 [Streptomyces sp. Amel2xB2]|uniref:DUF6069 family protein n=1 Tax=Streptomyces sp. Amel2xB2 TaxID=1305829 RepID=UPI000DC02C37|nr:DUF6069 family protein [Streptomyces sp. Amel2xB2]RAJ69779.1 hypothetical protein K378_00934 [Streptomyces sp. Amel2xB2]
MAGPHDPDGPQDPRGRHGPDVPSGRGGTGGAGGPARPGGSGGPGGHGGPAGPQGPGGPGTPGVPGRPDGPFKPFEPVYGPGGGAAARGMDPYDDSDAYVPQKRTNGFDHDRPPGHRRRPPRVSAARLWAGGFVVALVAALAAAVALLLVREVLDIPVLAPVVDGSTETASTGRYALGAALVALAATAVLHLLTLATPQPVRFLGWIVALGTAAVMLLPFTTTASWQAKGGTAGVSLVVGIVIGTLLATVARTATASGRDGDAEHG